jgi:hypothetical protein
MSSRVLLAVGLAACAGAMHACAARAPAPPPSGPIDLPVGEPARAIPIGAYELPPPSPAPLDEAPAPEVEPGDLPRRWSEPDVPRLAFAEAMRRARDGREAFARLRPPSPAGAAPDGSATDASKAWFVAAVALVDQSSRMYAAAFHASDAPREGRVDAIAEAADLDASLVRKLDELGLATMPPSWKSDPTVHVTFEDVAYGPLRRWRDETRALARRCVSLAKEMAVVTAPVGRCAVLQTAAPAKVARAGDASSSECPCAPGDPLCSASIGGWCGAR